MQNMKYLFFFFKKKDMEVQFKTNHFYEDTLPKDFSFKDDVPARIPAVFSCP